MCKWGTDTMIEISGQPKAIDSCIATIVGALNKGGIATTGSTGSCCGHGKNHGDILLADGRALVIRDAKEYLREIGVMNRSKIITTERSRK